MEWNVVKRQYLFFRANLNSFNNLLGVFQFSKHEDFADECYRVVRISQHVYSGLHSRSKKKWNKQKKIKQMKKQLIKMNDDYLFLVCRGTSLTITAKHCFFFSLLVTLLVFFPIQVFIPSHISRVYSYSKQVIVIMN